MYEVRMQSCKKKTVSPKLLNNGNVNVMMVTGAFLIKF